MTGKARRYVGWTLAASLLVVIVVGLVPRDQATELTAEQRSERIAANLRCPFCSGESIAEATSSIARDLRDFIDEQVASGLSDDEIYAYFVDRYTERILLTPPTRGWGIWLWLLPVIGLLVGAGVIASRRRLGRVGTGGDVELHLASARRDLLEIDAQQAAGEIDDAMAARLRIAYEDELDALAALRPDPAVPGRDRRRLLLGGAVLVVGAVAITVGVLAVAQDRRPGELATGGVFSESRPPTDLADVSNEELETVVAANPDVIPMRLALARRYFLEGDFTSALPHYLYILERELNAEALANVGWMTYVSNEPEVALSYVERSIELEPDHAEAYWYLANIKALGLGDPEGAVDPLRKLLTYDNVPAEVRDAAERLLAQVDAS